MIALDNLLYFNLVFFINFFHFDILSRNVYIELLREYNMAGEKRIVYAKN
jgi:hypothetical protein